METEKEIALGEDIVETVRSLRVIRRSPYFAIKRILGEQPVDEEVASIQAKIKEVDESQSETNMTMHELNRTRQNQTPNRHSVMKSPEIQMYSTGFSFHRRNKTALDLVPEATLPPIEKQPVSLEELEKMKKTMNSILNE